MMIADVLAILDLGSTDASFIAFAQRFAQAQGARLTIAVAAPARSMEFSLATAGGYPIVNGLMDCAETKKAELAQASADTETHCYAGEIGELVKLLAGRAGLSDLTMFGAPSAYGDAAFRRRAVERMALLSGRPVLTVPENADFQRVDHVVLGWKTTREAARALNDMLPLLDAGATIDVAAAGKEEECDLTPVCDHLRRLGFAAQPHYLTGGGAPSELLLHFARRQGAQLLAVGAYGHLRFEEILLGGVTRDLVEGASGAVLFSH